jgi:microsomal dipeptidase-like Zn-dependent dipeptidase
MRGLGGSRSQWTAIVVATLLALVALLAAAAAAVFGLAPRLAEQRRNRLLAPPPYGATERARALHRDLTVVDLHNDSLLWGRDLLERATIGHLDVPRAIEGGLALGTYAASTKVPRRANMDRNDGTTDDVVLLAIAQRWPRSAWTSPLGRALYLAARLHAMAAASDGRLHVITSAPELEAFLARRAADAATTAGLLSIEGAHALEGTLANLDRIADAGYRMISPVHLFDNEFAGSAHGFEKGGLTALGRELIERLETRSIIVDVAHGSVATIDDILSMARRPVVASHTGVRASFDSVRNLPDDHVRGIAATGGVIGIGFWPTVTGGEDVAAIARSIEATVAIVGVEHVALGSDFDGAMPMPFDVTGLVQLTDALLAEGFSEPSIKAIMGGNAIRVLRASLPGSDSAPGPDQSNGAMSAAARAAPSVSTAR